MAATLKPKKYQVLGSYEDFNTQLQATIPPPKPPEPDTVDNVDHREFPQEVWFAATISPDRGESIIRSYREIAKAREAYQHQLDVISTVRQHQELVASAPGTFRKPGTTITKVLQQGADTRKLNKFELVQQDWEVQNKLLSRATQRPANDLAMQRGALVCDGKHTWLHCREHAALASSSMCACESAAWCAVRCA